MAATLNFHLRERWRALRRGRPGHRFQDHYEHAHCHAAACGAAERILLVIVAIIALAIGAVLSVVPGPAIPFFFVAGGLLAAESRTVAKFMDWAEVLVRRVFAWGKSRWRRLNTIGRALVLVLFACGSAATGYVAYRFLAG
jgi:hypothetical protein